MARVRNPSTTVTHGAQQARGGSSVRARGRGKGGPKRGAQKTLPGAKRVLTESDSDFTQAVQQDVISDNENRTQAIPLGLQDSNPFEHGMVNNDFQVPVVSLIKDALGLNEMREETARCLDRLVERNDQILISACILGSFLEEMRGGARGNERTKVISSEWVCG